VTEASHAVFLSYASQDAEAAQTICQALRVEGIEVFLDQSELRGGDAWDQKIRREIRDCALFIPVISANTASRHEGYFRLEWDLADQRTHMIARSRAFLVPVCLDATTEVAADVPESFKRVQWTHLPGGHTPPAFVERIKGLLSPQLAPVRAVSGAGFQSRQPPRATWRAKPLLLATTAVAVCVALAYLVAERFHGSRHPATFAGDTEARAVVQPAAPAFDPPPHSIAVLPFTNLSGDPKEDYFSDGISEELINALSQINSLEVIARTSSFAFKGQNLDIATIARRLNVRSVLEGSIRRSGNTVRITAQLINAVNGYHIWSQDYDRDLTNVLELQTDIATTVAQRLRAGLAADDDKKVDLGATRNPLAYDAYLHGMALFSTAPNEAGIRKSLDFFNRAAALDGNYAMAYVGIAAALSHVTLQTFSVTTREKALADENRAAERAVTLAPNLADAHLVLWVARTQMLQMANAVPELQRALALAPGRAWAQMNLAVYEGLLGHMDLAIAATRRAIQLDPDNALFRIGLIEYLMNASRFREALDALEDLKAITPQSMRIAPLVALIDLNLGHTETARQLCESDSTRIAEDSRRYCLALVYHKTGDHQRAESELRRLLAIEGDTGALDYAEIYAQWGDTRKALQWLTTAERLRDPGLLWVKAEWAFKPIRDEPLVKTLEDRLSLAR